MKAAEKLKAIKKKVEDVKQEVLKEILEDDSLSKVEKLEIISENQLWPVSDWIDEVFTEWENECRENEKKAAIADGKDPDKDYISDITDDYFVLNEIFYDRRATVYYMDAIEGLEYRIDDKGGEEIVVVRNRGNYKSVVKKTPQEVIDRICDFCFENKVIGCVVDW